jgi:hypothetical protein
MYLKQWNAAIIAKQATIEASLENINLIPASLKRARKIKRKLNFEYREQGL